MAKYKHNPPDTPWPERITDELGGILKDARENAGYTRAELSERTGISERYLIAIENEKRIPKLPILCKLVRGLGLPGDDVFYPEQKISADTDPETAHLIRLIYTCDVEDRRVVLALVDALLNKKTLQFR